MSRAGKYLAGYVEKRVSKFQKDLIPVVLPQNKTWVLFTKCYLHFDLKPGDVLRELGYFYEKDISNPEQSWQDIKGIMELKRANTDKRNKPSLI